MKRTVYIFCLWWATLAVLSVSIMLHHHHVDEVCFALEECASDGNINDIHTQHAPTEGEGTPSDYCAVETAKQFIPARGTASMSAKWGGAQTSHPLVWGVCALEGAKATRAPARPRATHPVARGILFFGRTAGTTDGVTISHLLYFMT